MSSSTVIGNRWTARLFAGLLAVLLFGSVAGLAWAEDPKADGKKSPPAAKDDVAKAKQIKARMDELEQQMSDLFQRMADDPTNEDLPKELGELSTEFNRLTAEHTALTSGGKKSGEDLDAARRRAMESIKKGSPGGKGGLKPVRRGAAKTRGKRPSLGAIGPGKPEPKTGAQREQEREKKGRAKSAEGLKKPTPATRGKGLPKAGGRLKKSPIGSRKDRPNGKSPAPASRGTVKKPAGAEVSAPKGAGGTALPTGDGPTKATVTSAKTEMQIISFDMTTDSPESRTYRFQYVETPWVDVLMDFARVSGLPPVDITDFSIPEPLTYYSTETFTFREALHKLNELLLMRPLNNYVIHIKEGDYLTVNRLPDLIRKISPDKMFDDFDQFIAANLDPYDVCQTQYIVPEGWMPFQIIEEFRPKFSDTYGTQIIGERTLELTGLVREHYLFKEVIEKLTRQRPRPPRHDERPMRVFQLKLAKAADVQSLLRQLYPVSGPAPKRGGKRSPVSSVDPATENAKRLNIVPDIKNNWLYVKGPPFLLEEIAKTIESVDGDPWIPSEQEVVPVVNASAGTIVGLLRPIFQKQAAALSKSTTWIAPEVKNSLVCDMYPNVSSNSIILVGGRSAIDRAKRLIASYDVRTDWINEIIRLQHADAQELANQVISALPPTVSAAAPRARGPKRKPVARIPRGPQTQLSALTSRKLLLSCPKQDYDQVMELVAKFDVPNEDEPREHFVQLEHAVPSDIMSTLAQLVKDSSTGPAPRRRAAVPQRKRVKGRPPVRRPQVRSATGSGPVFLPDDAARMLIVFCADKDWERVEALVRELDALAGNVEPVLRSVSLANADAVDVANMLNQMFAPAGAVQQMVTADAHNNTVELFAIPSFIEKVLPLIAELDVDRSPDRVVIQLVYAKARVIAPILQQIFSGSGRAQPIRRARPVRKGKRPQPVRRQPAAKGHRCGPDRGRADHELADRHGVAERLGRVGVADRGDGGRGREEAGDTGHCGCGESAGVGRCFDAANAGRRRAFDAAPNGKGQARTTADDGSESGGRAAEDSCDGRADRPGRSPR